MSKLALFLFSFLAIGAMASHADAASTPTAPDDFNGQVEVHTKPLHVGEDLLQIIDHTRGVVCYGKVSTGGASTISCQKLADAKKK